MTVRSGDDAAAGERRRARENDIVPSLDLKWRPRADVVVDATLNPDFSQVELDTPQLAGNTQFALFFPEKRPVLPRGRRHPRSRRSTRIYTRSVTDPVVGRARHAAHASASTARCW